MTEDFLVQQKESDICSDLQELKGLHSELLLSTHYASFSLIQLEFSVKR